MGTQNNDDMRDNGLPPACSHCQSDEFNLISSKINSSLDLFFKQKMYDTVFEDEAKTSLAISLMVINYFNHEGNLSSLPTSDYMTQIMLDNDMRCLFQLFKGIILQRREELIDIANAKTILKQIITEGVSDSNLVVITILQLCEILFDEYKIRESQSLLDDITNLSDEVYQIGQVESSKTVVLESMLLKSNISSVKGNLQETQNILDLSAKIALDNEMDCMVYRIDSEKDNLRKSYLKWVEMLDINKSFKNQFENEQIRRYVDHAADLRKRAVYQKIGRVGFDSTEEEVS
jgi:hypothetical protein